MRRTRRFRASALIVSSWFALVLSEPTQLHLCPMHSMQPMAGHAMPASDAMDDMSAGAAADDATPDDPAHPAPAHHAHSCTCITCCAASRAIVPAAVAAALPAAATSTFREVAYPSAAAHRPSPPEHARPPSLAPPALSA